MSRSNTEANYHNLANLVADITWLQSLHGELKVGHNKTPILWCDNLSIVLLSANLVQHARTKHIELDLYFVCEKVLQRAILVQHIPSIDQAA